MKPASGSGARNSGAAARLRNRLILSLAAALLVAVASLVVWQSRTPEGPGAARGGAASHRPPVPAFAPLQPNGAGDTPASASGSGENGEGMPAPPGSPGGPGAVAGAAGALGIANGGAGSRPREWPRGPLAISGRALERTGAAVAGLKVLLVPQELAGQGAVMQAAATLADGAFEFRDLPDGSYELRAEPTLRHLAARTTVRAGVTSAVLLLTGREGGRSVRVAGVVTTGERRPLAMVDVLPVGEKIRAATDANGRYQVELVLDQPGESPSIRFRRAGYRDQRISVAVGAVSGPPIQADVVMDPTGEETHVAGTVKSADGAPIAGATVQLRSAQRARSFRTGTDLAGRFAFAKVEAAPDYRLWVRAKQGYGDHLRDGVAVGAEPVELPVVLQPLKRGNLAGRFLDPEGRPLPGFSLRLRSAQDSAAVRVTADVQGRFAVADLPAGRLSLDTEAAPSLTVSGIDVAPEREQTVDITLDWGDYEIRGRVQSADARPLAGSEVQLHWLRQSHGVTSQSERRTITDQAGYFHFARLGRSPHGLSVVAPGYHSARRDVEPSPAGAQALEVQLQQVAR